MVEFNDRRGSADRVTGFIQKLMNPFMTNEDIMRGIVTPINPNGRHPVDIPGSSINRALTPEPQNPALRGMDISTGLPIPKKTMRQARKQGKKMGLL